MNKKSLFILPLVGLLLTGCNKENEKGGENTPVDPSTPIYEQGPAKATKGTGLLFSESLGFNTKDAAIIEENGERYLIYVSNETNKGDQVFAARKAIKQEDKWVYGEKHIVFRPSTSGWDKRIFNPSILKGSFAYSGTTYSYLMAYNGNATNGDIDNSIGLAVSNSLLGEWTRVGNKPIIGNPEIYEGSYGFGSPSMVSYDNAGKAYMFYSVGETETSYGVVTSFDFSNLNDIKQGGYSAIQVTGLDDGQDVNIYMNGGVAFSQDGKTMYLVKDRLPNSANRPGSTKAVTVAKTSVENLGTHKLSWEVLKTFAQDDSINYDDFDSFGWDEIYSGEFVTDGYGRLINNDKLEVVYSTFSEDGDDISYSSTLCSFEVPLV